MENVQGKFDRLAADYTAKYKHPSTIFSYEKLRRMELVVNQAKRLQPKAILDAGCGPGLVLATLNAQLSGTKLVGVDLSSLMVEQARRNNSAAVDLRQCSVEDLPFEQHAFDLIYALGVMDYLNDLSPFFRAVNRVLRPGGYFIFTYPNGNSVNRSIRQVLRTVFTSNQAAVCATAIQQDKMDQLLLEHGLVCLDRTLLLMAMG